MLDKVQGHTFYEKPWKWSVMLHTFILAQLQVKILNMLNNNTKKYTS